MTDLDLTEAVEAAAQALREAGWDYDPHSLPPTPENLAAAAVAVAAPIIAAQVSAEALREAADVVARLEGRFNAYWELDRRATSAAPTDEDPTP